MSLVQNRRAKNKLIANVKKQDFSPIFSQFQNASKSGFLNEEYLSYFDVFKDILSDSDGAMASFSEKLLQLGEDGEVSGDQIQDAFQQVIDEQFELSNQTGNLGQSFKSLGKAILGALGNMAIMAAISFLISSAIQLYNAWKNVHDEMLSSAKELGKEFKDTESSIADYKEEVESLQNTLKDNNTSQEEAIAARERLLAIQDELIEKYGNETTAINNISKAITGEVDALDQLTENKWQETINAFNNPEDKDWAKSIAQSWWRKANGGADTNFEALINAMEQTKFAAIEFETISNEVLDELSKLDYVDITKYSGGGGNTYTIDVVGDNLQDIYDKILSIQTLTKDFDEDFSKSLTKKATDIKQTLTAGADIYSQYVLHDYIMGSEYEKTWQDVRKQYEIYNKAFIDGNEEVAEEEKQKLLDMYSALFASLGDTAKDSAIKDFFEKLFPAITAELKKTQIDVDFNPNFTGNFASEYQNSVLSAINQFSSIDDVLYFNENNATEGQKKAYNVLEAAAEKYGMTIDELIKKLKELFGLDILMHSSEQKSAIFENATSVIKNANEDSFNTALEKLEDVDYNQVKTFTESDWNAVEEHLKAINEEQKDNYSSASDWAQAMREVADETRSVAAAQEDIPEWSNQTFSEQVNGLDALQSAYENFRKNVEDKAPKINLDISEVDALREKFGDLEGFEEFEITVTSDTSTVDEIDAAFEKMLNQYANTKIDLKALSDETKEMARTQLEMEGATSESAKAFIDYHNEIAKGIKLHQQTRNMTLAEAKAYVVEANASDIARAAMFQAAAAEQVFNNNKLDVSDKVAKLKELAQTYLSVAQSADLASQADAWLDDYKNGRVSKEDMEAALAGLTSNIQVPAPEINWDPVIGGAKDAGSKAGDEFANAFQKKLEQMNSAISAVGTLMSSKITAANSAKDAAIKSLNEEKEAALAAIKAEQKARVDAINAEIKAIDKQIKEYEKQQKVLQDQIKAIQDANAARERQLNLQQAIANLYRAEQQRTKLVF